MQTNVLKHGTRTGLIGFLAGLLFLLGSAQSAQADEWRVATLAPDGSAWMKILSKGAEKVSTDTEGRVKIKYYTGGVQGDEKDVIRKMNLGSLDGGAFTSVGLSQIEASIRVLELPLIFDSVEEMDYVRRKMWGTFMKRFAKKGFILLDPGDVGPIHFFSAKPIKSAADLKAHKVWQWGEDKLVKTMFKKLGVKGVPMGVPSVLSSLTTGKINACYGSPLSTVALQWYTKVKYMTSVNPSFGVSATVIKKEAWDKMSDDDRAKVKKALRTQAKKLRKTVRKDNVRAQKAIVRSGVKVIEIDEANKAKFREVAEQVWNDMQGKMYSKKDLERVLKYREEFRSK